ncbi:hypothetical protein [Gluconobacter kondonii]|uniref:hypothetical protein n=1 Tax=Gluconobacter kondonii TaxID=941463 RepID=UPI001B8B24C4|nr:hypothetical protein [Gluconobacter kondonii]MBS1057178.1 hypothetical protein [Gluconobacter kondonii]
MAIQRTQKKAGKSESLTIRLDPKMRFALEFVARLNGQTITKVIERAVTEAADRTKVDDGRNSYDAANWRTYWDVSEGVRAIKLAMDENTHPTFEEEEMLEFVRTHWRIFAQDQSLKYLRRENIEIIWPIMPKILDIWRETKASPDRSKAASIMQDALIKAGVSGTIWAIPEKSPPELDDDLPPF